MTYGEFVSWVKYANKTGPLRTAKNLGMAAAFIAQQFATAYLKKKDGSGFRMSDFMLWAEEEQKEIGSPDQIFEMFKSLAASGNQDG